MQICRQETRQENRMLQQEVLKCHCLFRQDFKPIALSWASYLIKYQTARNSTIHSHLLEFPKNEREKKQQTTFLFRIILFRTAISYTYADYFYLFTLFENVHNVISMVFSHRSFIYC